MGVRSEWVELKADDGTSLRAWTARPDGRTPTRGLMVFQEAFGVNPHIRDVTERFAAARFLAISPELFHRSAPGFEGSYTDFPGVMPHLQAISESGLEADVRAAFGWLERAGVADASRFSPIPWCRSDRRRRTTEGTFHRSSAAPLASPARCCSSGAVSIITFPRSSARR